MVLDDLDQYQEKSEKSKPGTPIPEIAEQIDPENFEIMDLEEETKWPQGKVSKRPRIPH